MKIVVVCGNGFSPTQFGSVLSIFGHFLLIFQMHHNAAGLLESKSAAHKGAPHLDGNPLVQTLFPEYSFLRMTFW